MNDSRPARSFPHAHRQKITLSSVSNHCAACYAACYVLIIVACSAEASCTPTGFVNVTGVGDQNIQKELCS